MTPESLIMAEARASGSITTTRVMQIACTHLPEGRRSYQAARVLGQMVKVGRLRRVKQGLYEPAHPSPRLAAAGAQNCSREASN